MLRRAVAPRTAAVGERSARRGVEVRTNPQRADEMLDTLAVAEKRPTNDFGGGKTAVSVVQTSARYSRKLRFVYLPMPSFRNGGGYPCGDVSADCRVDFSERLHIVSWRMCLRIIGSIFLSDIWNTGLMFPRDFTLFLFLCAFESSGRFF